MQRVIGDEAYKMEVYPKKILLKSYTDSLSILENDKLSEEDYLSEIELLISKERESLEMFIIVFRDTLFIYAEEIDENIKIVKFKEFLVSRICNVLQELFNLEERQKSLLMWTKGCVNNHKEFANYNKKFLNLLSMLKKDKLILTNDTNYYLREYGRVCSDEDYKYLYKWINNSEDGESREIY